MVLILLEQSLIAGKAINLQQLLSHTLSSAKYETVINLQMRHRLIHTSGFLK